MSKKRSSNICSADRPQPWCERHTARPRPTLGEARCALLQAARDIDPRDEREWSWRAHVLFKAAIAYRDACL